MKLPEWTKAVFPSPLESIWTKQIHGYLTRYEEMVRLVAGSVTKLFILKLNILRNYYIEIRNYLGLQYLQPIILICAKMKNRPFSLHVYLLLHFFNNWELAN